MNIGVNNGSLQLANGSKSVTTNGHLNDEDEDMDESEESETQRSVKKVVT